jgi:LacI family transcriptional regulator
MSVTSRDVARELGISQSTVSRALRQDPRVADATIKRVAEAAKRMHYTPNLAGRSLITRRSTTVGIVVSDITNPFYPELVEILHNEFAVAGYRSILLNERTDAHLEAYVTALVRGTAVDGLVYASAMLNMPLIGNDDGAAFPVVLLNRAIDSPTVDTVVSDNRAGGRLAAKALVTRGHTRIALVSGPENTSTGRDREIGFLEQLQKMQVPFDPRLRRTGPYSHESGLRAGIDLLGSDAAPTAIFAGNDVMAFGVLDAARQLGLAVPERVSVIGFDDIDMADWAAFGLTTIRQPLAEMSRAAAKLLLDRLAPGDLIPARMHVFPVEVVDRSTLGPPHRA